LLGDQLSASILSSMPSPDPLRRVGVVLFDRFELLDVFGPLELLGLLPDRFELRVIGPTAGPVRSAQGPEVVADDSYAEAPVPDIVLVPGGIGTRSLVEDSWFVPWLAVWAEAAELVTSVCTGSGVLAAAGLLDGYRATSNKRAFAWAQSQGPKVDWIRQARWVADRDRWTSAGVAAGMDMMLALIAHLHGVELASHVADRIEYDWHRDSTWDPFAAKNGLS
jgi:transcriptional regulator GlxA family with amidase domain